MPVTTTLRSVIVRKVFNQPTESVCGLRSIALWASAEVRLDVIDGRSNGLNLVALIVWNRSSELVLKLHDKLDNIEAVGIEIIRETRFSLDFSLVETHLLGDDGDDLFLNLCFCHGLAPVLFKQMIEMTESDGTNISANADDSDDNGS